MNAPLQARRGPDTQSREHFPEGQLSAANGPFRLIEPRGGVTPTTLRVEKLVSGNLTARSLIQETTLSTRTKKAIRGATIPVEVWTRLQSVGCLEQLSSRGIVRLEADPANYWPGVVFTGVSFSQNSVQHLVDGQATDELGPLAAICAL